MVAKVAFLLVLCVRSFSPIWILKNWNWFFTTSPPAQLQKSKKKIWKLIFACVFYSTQVVWLKSVPFVIFIIQFRGRLNIRSYIGTRKKRCEKQHTTFSLLVLPFFIMLIDVRWNWKVPGIVSFTRHIVWI